MPRPADVLLVLRVACVAALVPAVMHLPLPHVSRLLRPHRRRRRRPVAVERVVQAWETAARVGRPVVRSGCLSRAVTLYWFLSRAGMPVELCFGITTEGPPVGHAWLVCDGAPFLEGGDPGRYTVTYRVGPGAV